MAPSASDYRGAGRGAVMLGVPLLVGVTLFAMFYSDAPAVASAIVDIFSPLFAVLILTVLLCSLALLFVFLLTSLFPVRYKLSE